MGAEQVVRRHHTQHGVSQKLQPLIALAPSRLVLVGVGAVGQSVFQQGPLVEAVTQLFFQGFHGRPSLS